MATTLYKYDERFLWRSGSLCSVYSRSNAKWCRAVINSIFLDTTTNKEWFVVKYTNNKRKKKKFIQRLSQDIRPISKPTNAYNTVWFIGNDQNHESGHSSEHISETHRECNDHRHSLTLCEWSLNIRNIICINGGLGFNIYTISTEYDELIVFGYIKLCCATKLAIPNRLILHILHYFGHNYNQYWSVGLNDFGQCSVGHSHELHSVTPIQAPNTYDSLGNMHRICIGVSSRNVLWIKNNGVIYINGRNLQKHNTMEITIPVPCIRDQSLKCIEATASHFHCMVLCNDGSVWSLGRGAYGELGHGRHPKLFSDFFGKIKSFGPNKCKIVSISAGNYFSLFLSDNGNVWSCGINTDSQLGLGYSDSDRNRFPTKIEYFERSHIKIKRIKCGESHSLALDTECNIYCWGKNNVGQCAINISIEEIVSVPTCIRYLSNTNTGKITDIKTGNNHSGCITEKEDYYLWGCNDHNECCMPHYSPNNSTQKMIFKPNCINPYIYDQTNGKNILHISLGLCNTMLICR